MLSNAIEAEQDAKGNPARSKLGDKKKKKKAFSSSGTVTSNFKAQQCKAEYSKMRNDVVEMIVLQDSRAMREP